MFRNMQAFTLIEVMVALLILALALTALQLRITQHVNSSAYLRDKTIASWVAQNQLELLRLENKQSNEVLRESRFGSEMMVGREWFWQITSQLPDNTSFEEESLIVPVIISVADNAEQLSPLIRLTGVVDAYHRFQ